jgi:hypothetical protein
VQAPRRHRLALLSLALLTQGTFGASFQPGADPPTGERIEPRPEAAEPLQATGIRWEFAPWRRSGSISLDQRWVRLEDGRRSGQTSAMADAEFASYVWQPWFVQVRLGGTVLTARSQGDGTSGVGEGSSSINGRLGVSVFPSSRFPFELRADSSDSRVSGNTLTGDYTSRRVSLSQGYRPVQGNDHYQLNVERSVITDASSHDTLTTFNATGLRQMGAHTLDLGLSHSEHERSDSEERTRISAANARHGYAGSQSLQVETMASWNEFRVGSAALETGSDIRQLSTYATWRPSTGLALWKGAGLPLVAATARWVQVQTLGNQASNPVQAVNLSLGASQELSSTVRTAVSGTLSEVRSELLPGGKSAGLQGSLTWVPTALELGGWRYMPSLSGNLGYNRAPDGSDRKLAGAQASHGLAREYMFGSEQQLTLGFTHSVAVLHESGVSPSATANAFGANLSWQRVTAQGSQTTGGISYSDSHTRAISKGRFQLINLQLSQRNQLSRHSLWAANVTVQGSRNESSEVDAFTAQLRDLTPGWQRFYSGTLSYEHGRAFDVPGLRYSLLVGANSQMLEKRSLGDIDASRERISESIESRLDYNIGRLETRLSARAARVDGRSVAAVQARVQRRF